MRASEAITIQRGDTEPHRVRCNGIFLLDAVRSAPEGDLTFLFGGDRVPILINPTERGSGEFISVVMPLVEKK